MTKKELKLKCSNILNKYAPGDIIEDKGEENFLMSIFINHTEWQLKKGAGVKSIGIMRTPFGNNCFSLLRNDGSLVDISFLHCISHKSPRSNINAACRNAISPTIKSYRDRNVVYGETLCPITGVILDKENCHIDHYNKTFKEVLDLWLADKNTASIAEAINSTDGLTCGTFFTDEKLKNDFVSFHNKNTHLRAVTSYANTVLLRRRINLDDIL